MPAGESVDSNLTFTSGKKSFKKLLTEQKNADKILCYDVYQFTVGGIDISSGLYKAVFWTARE